MSRFVDGIWSSSRTGASQVAGVTEKVANFLGKNRFVCCTGVLSTVMQVTFLLLLGLLGFVALAEKPKGELLFVQVIWRHGDRAPSEIVPKNPNTADKWKFGLGMLTSQGMDQPVELGTVLKELYIDGEDPLLSPFPARDEYYFRSTEVDRTMATAAGVASGMFPKTDGRPAKSYLVPVHATPASIDYGLNVLINCHRAEQLRNASFDTFNETDHRENSYFYKLVEDKTGRKYNLKNLWEVYDNYLCDTFNNMIPADWLAPVAVDVLRNITQMQVKAMLGLPLNDTAFTEFTRMRGGSVLKTIVDKFSERVKCHKDKSGSGCEKVNKLKFMGYSAHDVTIAHLMTAISRDWDKVHPGYLIDYTGAVAFELWKKNGQYQLRILYRRGPSYTFKPVTGKLRNSMSEFWQYEHFIQRITKYLPTDWVSECAKNKPTRQKRDTFRASYLSGERFPEWDVALQSNYPEEFAKLY